MAFDFKKMVADDRRLVFLNLAEFGEEHKVDGKTITVVLDDNAPVSYTHLTLPTT